MRAFHEIRGRGARLHQSHQMAKNAVRELLTHSDERTTAIYRERGDFHPVVAPFRLRELLGAG